MKLKRSTQVLLLLAVLLGGGFWLYDGAIAPQQEARRRQEQKLFSFDLDTVTQITLATSSEAEEEMRLRFRKLAEPIEIPAEEGETFSTTNWEYVQLEVAEAEASETEDSANWEDAEPANEAYVSFLLTVLANAEGDRAIATTPDSLAEYGLDNPLARLTLTRENGDVHELLVGSEDFTGSLVYVLVNSPNPTEELQVLLLPTNIRNAVDRPLEDWEAQPLPAPPTPDATPEATPEATPSPTPETTPNPTPAPTPEATPEPTPDPTATPEAPEVENR